jgi:hypothetical protein
VIQKIRAELKCMHNYMTNIWLQLLGYIHLVERTELVIGETSVTSLHSILKSRDRGKKGNRNGESKRTIEGGQNT